ncbi:hypothetical protein [Actinomadura chokoriensis]|uniref:hypothetical protein n=1 Tax=Actinomadura chokoriensis TaxID=454156 RepID=UPI0031F9CD9D
MPRADSGVRPHPDHGRLADRRGGWQRRLSPGGAHLPDVLGPALLISAGGGLLNTPLTNTVTAGVPRRDAGGASGLMNTAKQTGAAALALPGHRSPVLSGS